jgi:PAS domain S-box-containing protein
MESPNIMIVEDEPILSKDLSRLLERWGYNVVAIATTSEQAIERASAIDMDLVLMDIALDGESDGIECAIRIRELQDPALVYLTAHSEEGLFARAKSTEPQGYLGKPVSPLELQRTVEMALFKHRMEKRVRESEERLDLALKGAGLGMWDWDVITGNAVLSDTVYLILGYERSELTPTADTWRSMIHPDESRMVHRTLIDHLKSLTDSFEAEYRVRCKGGGWKWIGAKGKVFERDSAGKALRIVGTVVDVSGKRKAEEALRRSEERYRALVDTMNEGLATIDTDQRLTYVNESFARMLGYEKEELIGLDSRRIIDEKRLKDHANEFEDRRKGKKRRYETTLKKKDGQIVEVFLSGAPIFDEDGIFKGSFGIFTDITQLKEARRELERSNSRMEKILGGISDGLAALDDSLRITYFNKAAERLLGMSKEQALGRKALDAFPELEGSEILERYRKCLETGESQHFESYLSQGAYKDWYEIRVTPFEEGILVYFQVTTERKLQEQALRENEEKYRALFENLSYSALLIEPETQTVQEYNSTAAQTLEYEADELIGLKVADLDLDENAQEFVKHMELVMDKGSDMWESKIRTKSGKILDVLINASLVYLKGKPHILATCKDITERKLAERLLLQSERHRAVVDLSGGISHNFNNMLQIVVGNARLALTNLDLGNTRELRENLNWILETAKGAGQTIKGLNFFSRQNPRDSHEQVFDVSKTLQKALDLGSSWWSEYPEKGSEPNIAVSSYLTPDCYIPGDENEILELFMNLFRNAVEAIEDRGEIRVDCRCQDDQVIIRIADTGVGISAEELPRIFEPFYTTKGLQTPGMGLAGSLGVARRHRGDITVKSEEGKGSVAQVRFPRAEPVEAPTVVEDSKIRDIKDITTLIVDDLAPLLEMLAQGLESLGYTVFRAHSGEEAVEIVRNSRIDIIACDLSMPGMDGWQTAREIQDIYGAKDEMRPRFIMLTGLSESDHEQDHMKDGTVDSFIEKPVDIMVLSDMMQKLL